MRLPKEGLTSLVWGGALVVPAGLAWLARRARPDRAAWVLLAAAVPLVLLGVALRLPENNQSKFLNLLQLLLAAPAAIAWLAVWDRAGAAARGALAAGGALLALPTAALALWAFATECGRSPGSWHEPDAATQAGLAWVRERTPPGAAFADLAGAADLIAVGGRSVVWGGPHGERDWGADRDALQSRRLAVQALARGAEPGPAERAMLAALRREVIVTARVAEAGDVRSGWNVLPRAPGFRELFRNGSVAFYRWEGAR